MVAYVLLNGKPRILKRFAPGYRTNFTTEATTLTTASSNLSIPTLFEKDEKNHVLTLGYISGENMCDLLNDPKVTLQEKNRLMHLLSTWFIEFHTFFKTEDYNLIHGDATLRNFLFSTRIWGLDFEETRKGQPLEDIATLCASLLTTNPFNATYKYDLCTTFIRSYLRTTSYTQSNIANEIAYAVIQKIPYRPTEETNLRNLAEHVKNHQFLSKKGPNF
ncbi:MAG: hypothetical protein KKC68_01080 [Candidatus Thermoplasmatota archaeon]|nr:hypothetical protein [Candidatus Thermoplasmatota archaeon]MBU1940343.1 hypothetical protein [Candidatus Thermoplasmatota archaeon]